MGGEAAKVLKAAHGAAANIRALAFGEVEDAIDLLLFGLRVGGGPNEADLGA